MNFIKPVLLLLLLSSQLLVAREQVNINFSNLEINDFIKLIGKISKKNILINHKVNGTVNLVTSTPVYDDEVMGILISVLEAKGFTLVQNGSVYEMVRSTDVAKHNVRVIKAGKRASGAMMVTQTVVVGSANVDVVAAKVRYLISKTAKLMTMKESNTLLITDYPANIETIKQVIKDLDSQNSVVIKVVPIRFAEIKKLHQQISEIAKSLFNEKIVFEKVKILINSDINALVLVGKDTNVNRLATVLNDLDQEQNLNEIVQIFSLKNSDAANVLKTLNDITAKQTYSDPSMKPNISANDEINSIIIVGNPTVIKGLKRIVDELDKEKFQVYVQARIVEISDSESEKVGLRYGIEGGVANSSGLYTLAGNFGGSSVTISDTLMSQVKIDLGNLNQLLAIGAALDFLETQNASKTISNPSILCVNNKESSIYVGRTLSFQTGSSLSTGSVQSNSFKREDVGLALKIKPRVSSNEKVTLDVEVSLENVVGTDSQGQPITTKQNIVTQTILRHGESIVIGGLVKSSVVEFESKIPILGHIPLLGRLFTYSDSSQSKENLLVLLTPYVIEKSAKLSVLQEQLGELGRLQQKYNKAVFPSEKIIETDEEDEE